VHGYSGIPVYSRRGFGVSGLLERGSVFLDTVLITNLHLITFSDYFG
jgi:hypothetical protein